MIRDELWRMVNPDDPAPQIDPLFTPEWTVWFSMIDELYDRISAAHAMPPTKEPR